MAYKLVQRDRPGVNPAGLAYRIFYSVLAPVPFFPVNVILLDESDIHVFLKYSKRLKFNNSRGGSGGHLARIKIESENRPANGRHCFHSGQNLCCTQQGWSTFVLKVFVTIF